LTAPSFNRQRLSYDVCLEVRGRLSELFCVVLCTEVMHSHKHIYMSKSYSYLDWVLSHWAHFTVRRFVCVYLCVFVLYCIVAVLLWVQWGGPDGIEAYIRTYMPLVLW